MRDIVAQDGPPSSMLPRHRSFPINIQRPWTVHKNSLTALNRTDGVLALAFFLIGGVAAVLFLHIVGKMFFYQTHMSEMVMAGCGRAFAPPAVIPPALDDFLFMRTVTFDCSQLDAVKDTRDIGALTQAHLYLAVTVAALWRWFGVSYQSLAPLLALLNGAYAAGCFVLSRLFLRRTPSFLIGVALVLSPVAVSMLFSLRDFAKAPFVIWALVLLVLSLREHRPAQLIAISFGLGVVIGLGAGFRSDVAMIMFPLALGLLALAQSRRVIKLPVRLASLTAFLVSALALMAPLKSEGLSGSGGFYMMEGMSEPFRAYLGLKPAPYDLGYSYSDELTFSSISSDLRRDDPVRYDAGERKVPEQVTQAYRHSTTYVFGWAPIFAADLATRAVKSAFLMAGYYGAFSSERRALDPFPAPFWHLRAGAALSDRAVWLLDFLSRPLLMSIIGTLGLFALLLRVFARAPREAACLALILLVLLTFPSIQFSSRHFFHLEILVWLGVGSLLALPFEWRLLRRSVRAFALWAGAVASSLVAVYLALVAIQDRLVRAQIETLLASPRAQVITTASSLAAERVLLRVPVPPQYTALLEEPPDSLSLPIVETVMPSVVHSASDRLIIEIGGSECRERSVELKLSYAKRPGIWQALDRVFVVPVPDNKSERTLLITPAVYRPTQSFEGFDISASEVACLSAVYRVDDHSRLPAIFTAILAPNWRDKRLHLRLGAP
jgi:hypothetical protein